MQGVSEPRHIAVRSELDIVALRHTVRQFARAIGLDLPRQAKVTVAISAVARAFITDYNNVMFTVQIEKQLTRQALEIVCVSPNTRFVRDEEHLESQLQIHDVRMLVDDFTIALRENDVRLTMRMWLEH
jgi:anti-sigma regulatory factor (Ser/Thr protein kinase)